MLASVRRNRRPEPVVYILTACFAGGKPISNIEAGQCAPVRAVLLLHGLSDGLPSSYRSNTCLDIMLNWSEIFLPNRDYVGHGWGWRWILLFLAEVVQQCVILTHESILNHDLGVKKMR